MVAGRWFSREDEGDQATIPVVINQQLARAAFGDRNPVGAILPLQDRSRTPIRRLPERVVGVIEEFRKDGEFGALHHYEFRRIEVDRPPSASGSAERPPRLTGPGVFPAALLLRMAPDTPAAFEETLLKTAQAIARDWDFSIRPLEQDRQRELHTGFAVLAVPGLIGLFMLLMVALGLSGVLWQNVTERTGEFGLRRAHGASAAAVRAQVVGELFVLASFAVVPGAIMAAQLPPLLMLLRPDAAPPTIMLAGVVLAVVAIYLLIAVCGWYPSRMATRIRPAEALHYE
jgi:putative ABC transport system permease protein